MFTKTISLLIPLVASATAQEFSNYEYRQLAIQSIPTHKDVIDLARRKMMVSQTCTDDTAALIASGVETLANFVDDLECDGTENEIKVDLTCDFTETTASDSIRSTCESGGGKLFPVHFKTDCKFEDIPFKLEWENVHYCYASSCKDKNIIDILKDHGAMEYDLDFGEGCMLEFSEANIGFSKRLGMLFGSIFLASYGLF